MTIAAPLPTPPASPADAETATETFRREGYVVLDRALPPAFVELVRRDFEALLTAKIGRFGLAPAPRGDRTDGNEGVLNDFVPEGGNHDLNRWNMHLPSRAPFFSPEIVDNPAITGVLDRLLGPDWVYYIIASDTPYPNSGYQTAHQDYTRFSVAINIPLVDVTLDNGPMEVWPRTHRRPGGEDGFAPFSTAPQALDEGTLRRLVQEQPSQRLVMKAGSVLVRDHRLVHRGTANVSDAPRPMLSLYAIAPTPVPHRRLADLGAAAALAARRIGRGRGGAVEHRRLYDLGSVLGRIVEETALSDRDYRRVVPLSLWQSLGANARRHLRFARVEGRPDDTGDARGTSGLLQQWLGAVREAVARREGRPRVPDHYSDASS